MLPAARPSRRGRLARLAADELEVVVGTTEDDVVHQWLEAVNPQVCDSKAVSRLGDEARKLIGLWPEGVCFRPEGILLLEAQLFVAAPKNIHRPRMGVRARRCPRQDPGRLEPVDRNRRGVLGRGHFDPAARYPRQLHRLLPVLWPPRRQPVLCSKSSVLFGEKAVLDLPVNDSLALPATGLRQNERTVQRKRNDVLVVEPLHARRNVDESTVDALAHRRVPHFSVLSSRRSALTPLATYPSQGGATAQAPVPPWAPRATGRGSPRRGRWRPRAGRPRRRFFSRSSVWKSAAFRLLESPCLNVGVEGSVTGPAPCSPPAHPTAHRSSVPTRAAPGARIASFLPSPPVHPTAPRAGPER